MVVLDLFENISSVPKLYYGALFGLGFSFYYLFEVVKTPLLVCAKGPFRSFLEDHVTLVKNKFWPTLWCFESRAQTVLASIVRARVLPAIHYRREIFTLSDGGEVALDWAEENCPTTSPIVIILPGLTGASNTEYIKCLVSAAKKSRIRCVIFNNRGLGGVKLKTPRTYCAANCDDLAEIIEHLKKLHPNVPLGATGISMGGLILGNYLAQNGEAAKDKLKGCFIISVPWNVFAATKNIEDNYINLMLNKHLASNLCRTVKKYYTSLETGLENVDMNDVLRSQTVREFDSNFTTKQFGFKDVEEYYQKATLHDKLHLMEVPVLCLNAADDPFQPLEAIPLNEFSKTENVAIVVTSRGGHIGFLEGFWPVKEEQYISKLFCQYYTALFTIGNKLIPIDCSSPVQNVIRMFRIKGTFTVPVFALIKCIVFQSEPLLDNPYAKILPSSLNLLDDIATVPSSERVFGSRNTLGSLSKKGVEFIENKRENNLSETFLDKRAYIETNKNFSKGEELA